MKKILIIGGGFAGLSAAVRLTNAGFRVKVLESSPKLGGRAYSFEDEFTGDIIDNGQHIMMGCYHETLDFLKITGNLDNISIQKSLKVIFSNRSGANFQLSAEYGFYPFNLILGILSFKAISLKERISILNFFLRLQLNMHRDLDNLSVRQWLEREGQSTNSIRSLWEILNVGALNTCTSKASALMFSEILKQMFLKNSRSASIIIPGTGLSEMYCTGAANFLIQRGSEICVSTRVEKIILNENLASAVVFNGSEYKAFDYIVSAVPFHAVNKLINIEFINTAHFTPSSILSVHIWLTENNFVQEFYGLIDSEVHWIFNHKNYITIVISNADKFMQMNREEIIHLIIHEMKQYFPFFTDKLIRNYRIIKEKRATFIPDSKALSNRPETRTNFNNLFLAGDWINTGLPATIEGAVKSGRLAADKIISINS